MARILDEESIEKMRLMEQYEEHMAKELVFKTALQNIKKAHKVGFFHKLFKRNCEICKQLEVLK